MALFHRRKEILACVFRTFFPFFLQGFKTWLARASFPRNFSVDLARFTWSYKRRKKFFLFKLVHLFISQHASVFSCQELATFGRLHDRVKRAKSTTTKETVCVNQASNSKTRQMNTTNVDFIYFTLSNARRIYTSWGLTPDEFTRHGESCSSSGVKGLTYFWI